MKDRSATDTIRGYFYQFDHSIYTLLNANDSTDLIEIECIEDIDLSTKDEKIAIQCKYQEDTAYNHSVIKKPIQLMAEHFSLKKSSLLKYKLYGFYSSGQDKYPSKITLKFLKDEILTVKKQDGTPIYYYDEFKLNDSELEVFISLLSVDVNAFGFNEQKKEILKLIMNYFNCPELTADVLYYNNALSVIKDLASEKDKSKRSISKKEFLEEIDKSRLLFAELRSIFDGRKKYLASIRNYIKDFFRYGNNLSPFSRFFIIDAINENDINNLKHIISVINTEYSRTKPEEPTKFSPYFYINNVDDVFLLKLKKSLRDDGFKIIDGFDFLGADFNAKSITSYSPKCQFKKEIKILNSVDYLKLSLEETKGEVRHIYEFYSKSASSIFDQTHTTKPLHIKLKMNMMLDILEVI